MKVSSQTLLLCPGSSFGLLLSQWSWAGGGRTCHRGDSGHCHPRECCHHRCAQMSLFPLLLLQGLGICAPLPRPESPSMCSASKPAFGSSHTKWDRAGLRGRGIAFQVDGRGQQGRSSALISTHPNAVSPPFARSGHKPDSAAHPGHS